MWSKRMNTLSAAELKRRGMAAIEERLRRGPVHLVKRNKAAAVVLTEQQYAALSRGKADAVQPGMSAMQWLLSQPATGSRSRRQLDRALRAERGQWT
jgi:PHD/YefM family antitoxin component YafN of YafNO toxin-antitoxin module